jgi:ADP-heptose:LPS heptosyltransferase
VEFARLFSRSLALAESPGSFPKFRPRLHAPGLSPLFLIAGQQSPSRHLEWESWLSILQAWHQGRSFAIASSSEDTLLADKIVGHFGGMAQKFTGSFDALCHRISQSCEVLTMDGGMVHVASYFGVPTTALFTSGREKKWLPLAEGSHLIRRQDLPCQPCTLFGQVPPCSHRYACKALSFSENLIPIEIAPTHHREN